MDERGQAASFEVRRDGYAISSDPARLDRDRIFRYLHEEAYWSAGMARSVFERALAGSLNFGLYDAAGTQAGFARVITDYATNARLLDVFVLPEHRARGLGEWLVATVLSHPHLQNLRSWSLSTDDAHGLYERFGFEPVDSATNMVRKDPDAHRRER
jgi:GNAT superfamily N-acetyltransferase